jgi:hypothetical protein
MCFSLLSQLQLLLVTENHIALTRPSQNTFYFFLSVLFKFSLSNHLELSSPEVRVTVSARLPTEAANRDVLAEYGPQERDVHEERENSPAREPDDLQHD